ncbi:hypothetical protein VOLCADRAFT_91633 [Volvox carteri f. nagariensis]|uniref:Uncharacterized protein n=1 Tax=Volvox carteri f. nagariensis TaxID=3068 RepID=D8TXL0_VOLCA|nr:uncharacterized protein VOLCADRAFT_91633 [Volvox carteri f. nagariensis]EFJ47659.1 hypothetical protein VOLCADRAFT_91633 [Volvox carteri f. nagariensis]|eukprot:XP_002951130.1 hypothetical protein VOLCADRAFT_91633 [Volvox carteri f. nagariensis]
MLVRPSASVPGPPQRIVYGPQQRSFVPISNGQTPSFESAWQYSANNKFAYSELQKFGRRRVVAMSFLREALKGAKADVVSAGDDLLPRLARAARVARILGLELAAIAALAPYGAYAMSVYRSYPTGSGSTNNSTNNSDKCTSSRLRFISCRRVGTMVEEVSAALSWTFDNVASTKLERKTGAPSARRSATEIQMQRCRTTEVYMYDKMSSLKHYEFEKSRAVHELSMMKRAVGGPMGFAAASPSVILARAAAGTAPAPYDQDSAAAAAAAAAGSSSLFTSYFTSFELLGDAIPTRSGLNGLEAAAAAAAVGSQTAAAAAAAAAERGPVFNLAAASRLPPFVVMGSCSDHMVPWHEGAELVLQLRRCGVPVRHLLYNHVGHGDFVMAWRPLKAAAAIAAAAAAAAAAGPPPPPSSSSSSAIAAATAPDMHLEGLLPCGRDLLRIALGRVQLMAATAAAAAPTHHLPPGRSSAAVSAAGGDGELTPSGVTAPGLGLQLMPDVDEQRSPQALITAAHQSKL